MRNRLRAPIWKFVWATANLCSVKWVGYITKVRRHPNLRNLCAFYSLKEKLQTGVWQPTAGGTNKFSLSQITSSFGLPYSAWRSRYFTHCEDGDECSVISTLLFLIVSKIIFCRGSIFAPNFQPPQSRSVHRSYISSMRPIRITETVQHKKIC